MKKLKQYGYNIIANMGDNNNGFSINNKTSNRRVMCFIIVSIIALMIINEYSFNFYDGQTCIVSRVLSQIIVRTSR